MADMEIDSVRFEDICFEPLAHPEPEYSGKDLLTYDNSLERLRNAGYERHPRPAEAFSLQIANLEGKLTGQQRAVANDMSSSFGEWLSAAIKRKGNTLIVYFDPQGLVWDGSRYTPKNFTCSEKRNFPLAASIPSSTPIDLVRFSPELVAAMYGRPFRQLPPEIRDSGKPQLYLPPDGLIRPVGLSYFNYGFDSGNYLRVSRGCNPVGAKKSGKANLKRKTSPTPPEETLSPQLIRKYLQDHPDVVEDYLTSHPDQRLELAVQELLSSSASVAERLTDARQAQEVVKAFERKQRALASSGDADGDGTERFGMLEYDD